MKGRLSSSITSPRCVIPNITLCKYLFLIHFSSNNASCAPRGALGSLAETPAALFFPVTYGRGTLTSITLKRSNSASPYLYPVFRT